MADAQRTSVLYCINKNLVVLDWARWDGAAFRRDSVLQQVRRVMKKRRAGRAENRQENRAETG
jgi:hypothetical protein